MIDYGRFDAVRSEWLAISSPQAFDTSGFATVKAEADDLVARGRWVSGPGDVLSVLGRARDELVHSRMIGWLLVPTNRHALGRRFAVDFADRLWPGDGLLRSGPILVETEESGSALDETGQIREARADIVVRGAGVTIIVENKVDAGEQPDQCERLYWGWAAEAGDARYVFLTPSGRGPSTATSELARNAWRAMSYADLAEVLRGALAAVNPGPGIGRATAEQYLSTIEAEVMISA